MAALAENPRAVIGSNHPPVEMTSFEAVKINIQELYEEASQWLDGSPVETQEQADAINTLKARIKEAAKAADDARIAESSPLRKQIDDIQARYNDLIGSNKSVTGLAVKAEQACNAALKPYLIELDRQQQEKARLAREEADRKQQEAMEAMRQRDAANLAANEAAERLVQEAKQAEADASKAEKARAHARGDGRATGLRTVYRAVMTDHKEASAWIWIDHRDELMVFVQELADRAVRNGARKLPGFEIVEEKIV